MDETDCLKDLVDGRDVWPRFYELYGGIIRDEVSRFGQFDGQLMDNSFQELVLKLMANDHRVIRNHLQRLVKGNFGALIRKMTRNLLIDEWRKIKRRRELALLERDTGGEQGGTSSADDPAGAYVGNSRAGDILQRATGGDSNGTAYRIMSLRFIDGQSVSYIADELGMQPNAVSHQIRYYLKKLEQEHRAELLELSNE